MQSLGIPQVIEMLLKSNLQPDASINLQSPLFLTPSTSEKQTAWTLLLRSLWHGNKELSYMGPQQRKQIHATSTSVVTHFLEAGAPPNILIRIDYIDIGAYRVFMKVPASLILANLRRSCSGSATGQYPTVKPMTTKVRFYLEPGFESPRPAIKLDNANALHAQLLHAIAGKVPYTMIGSLPSICAEIWGMPSEPDVLVEQSQDSLWNQMIGWI